MNLFRLKNLVLMGPLLVSNLFAQGTAAPTFDEYPGDKKSVLKVDDPEGIKGLPRRVYFSQDLGGGKTKSTYSVSPYNMQHNDLTVKAGGTFLALDQHRPEHWTAAATPELLLHHRIDEKNKTARFEAEGKLAVLYFQQDTVGGRHGEQRIDGIEVQILGLGFSYRDLKDAGLKSYGPNLVILNIKPIIKILRLAEGSDIQLCADLDIGKFEAGKFQSGKKSTTDGQMAFSGAFCAKANLGPVIVSNTLFLRAKIGDVAEEFSTPYTVNNTARVAYRMKLQPAVDAEVGVDYTHSYDSIGGKAYRTNMLSAGVKVLAK